jgi:hypothetical protein
MPGDFSAAIYIDDRGLVIWALLHGSALSGGVNRWMFKQQESVGARIGDNVCMDCSLERKGLGIFHETTSL